MTWTPLPASSRASHRNQSCNVVESFDKQRGGVAEPGRRRPTRNRIGAQKVPRGFKSSPLRQLLQVFADQRSRVAEG